MLSSESAPQFRSAPLLDVTEVCEATMWKKIIAIGDELQRLGSNAELRSLGEVTEAKSFLSKTPAASTGVDLQQVRAILRARRLRSEFFAEEMFADPAWDILLALLASELAQTRMPVTALCEAAAVPPTTALRWIQQMTHQGLLIRMDDPLDRRRTFIALNSQTSQTLRRYFQAITATPI